MTILTSAIPAAIDYLVTQAKAAFPAALVLDGPMSVVDLQSWQDRITIGSDGDPDGTGDVAIGDQDFNALNRGVTKDETFSIICSVTHWDGNDDPKASRTAAFALLRGFELLMRGYAGNGSGDVTLGGAVREANVGALQVSAAATDDGLACTIVFKVGCKARLTGS